MKKALIAVMFFASLSSCSYKYTPDTSAMINVTDYDIGNLNALKSGESCSASFFGFSSSSSSTSVIDAMKNGNISKIKMVDKRVVAAPFFYKNCTIVHGL